MPVSPEKKTICLLPNRPDTKALNQLLQSMSSVVKKSPKTPTSKPIKSRNLSSPRAKRYANDSSQRTISGWLSKQDKSCLEIDKPTKKIKKDSINKKTVQESPKPSKITTTKIEDTKETEIVEKSSKPKLSRYNSGSSDELPTFKKGSSRKRLRPTETFKKYGVIVPSLDEMVADQEHFSNYKAQVEEAQTLKEPTFKMPLSPLKSNPTKNQLLDCNQLTLAEITEYFNENITFLRDIINGKKFSDRHRRYVNKKNKLDELTTKDLTYNTSTIVFTFEQLDHMVLLMHREFDPNDKKTSYFFKVLVPELCLKIFMETHDMNKREANAYLENRPVE